MNEKVVGFTLGTPLNPSVLKENMDMSGYASKDFVKNYAQPIGNYLTEHQDISGKLDTKKLPEAVNEALAQAKESGVFDGKDGKDGQDGEPGKTPEKGVDYNTPEDKIEMVNAVVRALNLPSISAADNNKIAQVVNGALSFVEVKNSSIATFVDEYISSALEGDY